MDTAVGCADILPPRNVWWKRGIYGANATFGCAGQSLPIHHMTCVGNDWQSHTTPDAIDCPDMPQIGEFFGLFITRSQLLIFPSLADKTTLNNSLFRNSIWPSSVFNILVQLLLSANK